MTDDELILACYELYDRAEYLESDAKFNELVLSCSVYLFALLRRSSPRRGDACGNSLDEEEIVCEVIVRVEKTRRLTGSRYDPAKGTFRNWLTVILKNYLRERNRRPRGEIPFSNLGPPGLDGETEREPFEATVEDPRPTPQQIERAAEFRDDVHDCLRDLSDRDRKALKLRAAGLKYREVGDELGVSTSQAHRIVAQALAMMRESLGKNRPGGMPHDYLLHPERRT